MDATSPQLVAWVPPSLSPKSELWEIPVVNGNGGSLGMIDMMWFDCRMRAYSMAYLTWDDVRFESCISVGWGCLHNALHPPG